MRIKFRESKAFATLCLLGTVLLHAFTGIEMSAQEKPSLVRSEVFSIYIQTGNATSLVPINGYGFKASSAVGFGADYMIHPWLRVGGEYKCSHYRNEQKLSGIMADGKIYGNYSASHHALSTTVGFNLLETFEVENPYGLGFWVSTGIGGLFGGGGDYGLYVKLPNKPIQNDGIKNIEIKTDINSAYKPVGHASFYIPFTMQLEAPLNNYLDLGVKLEADKTFGAKEYAPSALIFALVSLRCNFGVIR